MKWIRGILLFVVVVVGVLLVAAVWATVLIAVFLDPHEYAGDPWRVFETEMRVFEDAPAQSAESQRIAAEEARRQREAEERERARLAGEARREAAQQEIQEKLDVYMAVLELADVQVVERVSVRRIGDNTWEATLTVSNVWHVRHKQIRLQDAQTLWEAWATIASPNKPDSARIKLVDLRGNEVGGSRAWGGSLIWVKD